MALGAHDTVIRAFVHMLVYVHELCWLIRDGSPCTSSTIQTTMETDAGQGGNDRQGGPMVAPAEPEVWGRPKSSHHASSRRITIAECSRVKVECWLELSDAEILRCTRIVVSRYPGR